MFTLENQRCKLAHVNPRSEKNGKDSTLASDLKFEITASNEFLNLLHPELQAGLYRSTVKDPAPGYMPNLRFPFFGEIPWTKEYVGYELRVMHGIDVDDPIVLPGCIVNSFKIEAQEGGTVVVTFRVQCHPDGDTIGALCEKIQSEVEITLTPPTLSGSDLAAQGQQQQEKTDEPATT